MAGVGHKHGVFPLRGQRMVVRDHRPVVRQQLHFLAAGVDHRFDGEGHTRHQFHAGAGTAVMQHLWVFMKGAADAVPAVFAHHRATVRLGMSLDGVTDIAQAYAGAYQCDALEHAFATEIDQTFCLNRRFAYEKHFTGVAVKAVFDDRDIDIDDVALLKNLVARNSVADHVVDRGADGFGKAFIVEWGRDGLLLVYDVIVANAVEFAGTDTGLHMRRDHLEHLGRQTAGGAHFLDFFRGFDGDGHNMH